MYLNISIVFKTLFNYCLNVLFVFEFQILFRKYILKYLKEIIKNNYSSHFRLFFDNH